MKDLKKGTEIQVLNLETREWETLLIDKETEKSVWLNGKRWSKNVINRAWGHQFK